jgi:hypothetical protein
MLHIEYIFRHKSKFPHENNENFMLNICLKFFQRAWIFHIHSFGVPHKQSYKHLIRVIAEATIVN